MADTILEFDHVTYPLQLPFDTPLPECSFTVKKGELLSVRTEKNVVHSPLGSLALGLVAPQSGIVRCMGNDWQEMSPDAAAECRGHIGCVFAEGGWVSNLDIDENILLAPLHHTRTLREKLLAEATDLARHFGVKEVPHMRVHLVKRSELRVLEWVRALLGDKHLIVLQYPMNNVPAGLLDNLLQEIQRVREKGTGVLWITHDEHEWQAVSKQASATFELKEQHWLRVGGR